jgi:hypothetical protein
MEVHNHALMRSLYALHAKNAYNADGGRIRNYELEVICMLLAVNCLKVSVRCM